jgi:hypothetical protein
MVAMTLAGGSGIFAAFLILFLFAIVFALFTVKGSAISERPYSKVYGGAPGAIGPASVSGRDERADWRAYSRGTH